MSSRFRPAALIFDMDGLLLDSEPLWGRVEAAYARELGVAWTDEHAARCVGTGMRATVGLMAELAGRPLDLDAGIAAIVSAFVDRCGEIPLKRGARELLDAMRGRLPMAVASSSARRVVEAALAPAGLLPCFDAIVTGDDVERPKPEPEIFLLAARRLGVAAERCAVFEDSVAGATAGRAAGMFVVAIPENDTNRVRCVALADAVARDLDEARALLELPA